MILTPQTETLVTATPRRVWYNFAEFKYDKFYFAE